MTKEEPVKTSSAFRAFFKVNKSFVNDEKVESTEAVESVAKPRPGFLSLVGSMLHKPTPVEVKEETEAVTENVTEAEEQPTEEKKEPTPNTSF